MNGVNGNGGGIRSSTAIPIAPVLCTFRRTRAGACGHIALEAVRADLRTHPERERGAAAH